MVGFVNVYGMACRNDSVAAISDVSFIVKVCQLITYNSMISGSGADR